MGVAGSRLYSVNNHYAEVDKAGKSERVLLPDMTELLFCGVRNELCGGIQIG